MICKIDAIKVLRKSKNKLDLIVNLRFILLTAAYINNLWKKSKQLFCSFIMM